MTYFALVELECGEEHEFYFTVEEGEKPLDKAHELALLRFGDYQELKIEEWD